MTGYFVTGTDTDVGKTFVTCALARRARSRGRKVFAFKPIETGCSQDSDGRYRGADQTLLVEASGDWQRGPLAGLYQLPRPVAPLVAAQAAGTTFDLGLIVDTVTTAAAAHQVEVTLVEGAGGWRVPITPDADMARLARELGLPVLIVARAGLGTINHSLLTVEAVVRDGLVPAAVVLSLRPGESRAAAQVNRTEIHRRWAGPVVILDSDPTALDVLL
jgi:dethiobiotin synthetase